MKFNKITGVVLILLGLQIFILALFQSSELVQTAVALLIGLIFIFIGIKLYKRQYSINNKKDNYYNSSDKPIKKEIHTVQFTVAGSFLEERQSTLRKMYNDEFEHGDESVMSGNDQDGIIYLEAEPNNEHDKNAIAVHNRLYGQIGYVSRNKTHLIRLGNDYKVIWEILKEGRDFYMELTIQQKY